VHRSPSRVLPALRSSPLPILSPTTAGSWRTNGATLTFTPSTDLAPLGEIAITVPGGPAGVVGSGGRQPANPLWSSSGSRTDQSSVSRSSSPCSATHRSPGRRQDTDRAEQHRWPSSLRSTTRPGRYSWRDNGWPARLRATVAAGIEQHLHARAHHSFQADHGLVPNGDVEAGVWTSLIDALAANTVNTGGYNTRSLTQADPQSLTILPRRGRRPSQSREHRHRRVSDARRHVPRLHAVSATGHARHEPGRAALCGPGPVHRVLQRQSTRVHYMDRATTGIPQSLGCVELPLADAARAWPYLAYGTLVTIIN